MKLLIITQKIDKKDGILGFFYGWIRELSQYTQKISAICLYRGMVESDLAVPVFSLGKESKQIRALYLVRFYYYIITLRNQYDTVFVHMNQIYVILGYPIWKLLGKKVYLWYAHGSVSFSLRLAHWCTDGVITSTKEGFRLPSNKVHIVGQGIGIDQIKYQDRVPYTTQLQIISVGRIDPVKKYEVIFDALKILLDKEFDASAVIVGGVSDSERASQYNQLLQRHIFDLDLTGYVHWKGVVLHDEIGNVLRESNIFINASETGSLDKSGLEALAAGLPVFTCNESYVDVFGSEYANLFMFNPGDGVGLAQKIIAYSKLGSNLRQTISANLAEKIKTEHSLSQLMKKISQILQHE